MILDQKLIWRKNKLLLPPDEEKSHGLRVERESRNFFFAYIADDFGLRNPVVRNYFRRKVIPVDS